MKIRLKESCSYREHQKQKEYYRKIDVNAENHNDVVFHQTDLYIYSQEQESIGAQDYRNLRCCTTEKTSTYRSYRQ